MNDTTTATADAETAAQHDDHHGPTDAYFIKVAAILAVVTGVEVLISYIDIGPVFMPLLIALMLAKFFTVVLVFMHLKYDKPLFGVLFYMGLGLAVTVYLAALAMFHFFE